MAVAATAKTGGRAPSSKYLRIGQAKNEKSVSFIRSFIHFDMEWFPLSVFLPFVFYETLDAWDQVTHRTNFQ